MPQFDETTYEEAAKEVEENGAEWLDANRAFAGTGDYEDPDHWQEGEGVLGDLAPQQDGAAAAFNEGLKNVFVVEDLVSDVVRKRTTGVLGKPPAYALKREGSEDEEPSSEDEARQEALRRWFEDAGALDALKEFAKNLTVEAKAYLRPYVSLGALTERAQAEAGREGTSSPGQSPRLPDVASPEDALEYIHLQAVGRDRAALFTDPATNEELGVIEIQESETDELGDDEGEGKYVELTYLDDEGRTVYRVAHEQGKEDPVEWRAPLRGHLLLYEGESPLLITDSVRRNQKDLNTKRTQISISDNKTAFRSWNAIDVLQPAGEDGEAVEPEIGPGSFGFYFSVPTETKDADGHTVERQTSPQINESDPVDNSNLRANCDAAREAIYRSVNQLHRAISGDATASGESRIQARGEYVDDLKELKGVVDAAGVWLVEVVWALAEVLAGREPSHGLKGIFDCMVSPGPLTAAERKAILSGVEAGIISKKRARELWGVDDTEAEKQQIQKEMEEEQTPRDRAETERLQTAVEADRQLLEEQDSAAARRREIEAAANNDE